MNKNIFPIEELKAQKEKLLKKTAKKLAEDYLNSEEGKLEKVKMDREFMEFFLYGSPTTYFNNEVLKELCEYDGAIKVEELSVEQIIERFGDLLTEKDLKEIKDRLKL